MTTPTFNESILRLPEEVLQKILQLETNPLFSECREVAAVARLCLGSSATNDYLEKIGAESIGAKHLSDKLGADGDLHGEGVEVKPFKKSPGCKDVAVINDDTPMKLLKSHKHEKWLVLLCANKNGTQVNYAVCAPFWYWENSRYSQILKRLNLTKESGWNWDITLPQDESQRLACLTELVTKHESKMYVRSSPLSLDILQGIPRNEISFWVHPELPKKKLHPTLQKLIV